MPAITDECSQFHVRSKGLARAMQAHSHSTRPQAQDDRNFSGRQVLPLNELDQLSLICIKAAERPGDGVLYVAILPGLGSAVEPR